MTPPVPRTICKCPTCGGQFGLRAGDIQSALRRGRKPQVYCSMKCRKAGGIVAKDCARCGTRFQHIRAVRRTYCSRERARTARARQSRDDSAENLTTLCRACHFHVEFSGRALPGARVGA